MSSVKQLSDRLLFLIDDYMDIDTIINLFNEALEEIDTIYGEARKITVSLDPNEKQFRIPDDILHIAKVTVKVNNRTHEAKRIHTEYTYATFGGDMLIHPAQSSPMEVTVEHYGAVEKIPSASQDPILEFVPTIPERYHRALPLFAAARYFEKEEDNSELRNNYQVQFEKIKADLANKFQKELRASKGRNVIIERGWL